MVRISQQAFDEGALFDILAADGSSLTNPPAATKILFPGADGAWYEKDSAGVVTPFTGGEVFDETAHDAHDHTGLPGVGGGGTVGRAATAFPNGFATTSALTAQNLVANGGTLIVPIPVPAPMYLQNITFWGTDTTTARTGEARLYVDNGDATADFVTGTDAAISFTPATAALRRTAVSGAPVLLSPGVYWAAIRNTAAAAVLGLGRTSSSTIVTLTNFRTQTLGSALGASLDLDAGWTDVGTGVPAVWLEGRVIGRTTAL